MMMMTVMLVIASFSTVYPFLLELCSVGKQECSISTPSAYNSGPNKVLQKCLLRILTKKIYLWILIMDSVSWYYLTDPSKGHQEAQSEQGNPRSEIRCACICCVNLGKSVSTFGKVNSEGDKFIFQGDQLRQTVNCLYLCLALSVGTWIIRHDFLWT